ncbi:MAG: hypothetical protein IKU34_04630 [Clostridia bacterium]|nr:hypothetical protein [Clostridia bacterium]
MPGRIDRIDAMLRAALGDALIDRCPDMIYNVNQTLVRFGRTQDTLPALLTKIDSSLFNAVYLGTERTMLVVRGGARVRVTTDQIRDLSDRLLSLVYDSAPATPELQSQLFDFSREGSFAAMRVLAARFPLDEFEREYLMRVLEENQQTE